MGAWIETGYIIEFANAILSPLARGRPVSANRLSKQRAQKRWKKKGGAAAAVSALIAKAKLAGMWREKIDQHNTGYRQHGLGM